MKQNEIQVGTEYAVGRTDDYCNRAVVIEVGSFEKLVYGDHDWRGHKSTVKGAKVQYLNKDGSPRTDEHYVDAAAKWVVSREIQMTWVAYVERTQSAAQRQRSIEQTSAQLRDDGEPFGLHCYYGRSFHTVSYTHLTLPTIYSV